MSQETGSPKANYIKGSSRHLAERSQLQFFSSIPLPRSKRNPLSLRFVSVNYTATQRAFSVPIVAGMGFAVVDARRHCCCRCWVKHTTHRENAERKRLRWVIIRAKSAARYPKRSARGKKRNERVSVGREAGRRRRLCVSSFAHCCHSPSLSWREKSHSQPRPFHPSRESSFALSKTRVHRRIFWLWTETPRWVLKMGYTRAASVYSVRGCLS